MLKLLKTSLLGLLALVAIHGPSQASTPFVGTSVFATTTVQPAMVVDNCPFSYTAPQVPDCPNGHPRDLGCFFQCQLNYANDMDNYLNAVCSLYSTFLQYYNDSVQQALDDYTSCVNSGTPSNICRDICNEAIADALWQFNHDVEMLQYQFDLHKATADQTYLNCAAGCCGN